MLYYMYQITNNLNNKIYVGVHTTRNLDDGYMGSGKLIKRAINKHGIDKFTKVILECFDNAEAMYAREKEVVNEDFLLRDDVYNLTIGGGSGYYYINKNKLNLYGMNGDINHGGANLKSGDYQKRKMIEAGTYDNHLIKLRNIIRARYDNGFISHFSTNNPMYNEDVKRKQKQAFIKIKHQQGEINSQFNTRWVHNIELKRSKKIGKCETLPVDWNEGRVINFDKLIQTLQQKEQKLQDRQRAYCKKVEMYEQFYEIYKVVGFNAFVDLTQYDKSQQNLVMAFQKYVYNFIPQNGRTRSSQKLEMI